MATDSSLPLHHAAVASSVHRDRGGRACEQRIVRGREKEGGGETSTGDRYQRPTPRWRLRQGSDAALCTKADGPCALPGSGQPHDGSPAMGQQLCVRNTLSVFPGPPPPAPQKTLPPPILPLHTPFLPTPHTVVLGCCGSAAELQSRVPRTQSTGVQQKVACGGSSRDDLHTRGRPSQAPPPNLCETLQKSRVWCLAAPGCKFPASSCGVCTRRALRCCCARAGPALTP